MQYKNLQTKIKQYREMNVVKSGRCNEDGSSMCLDAKEHHLSIVNSGQSNGRWEKN